MVIIISANKPITKLIMRRMIKTTYAYNRKVWLWFYDFIMPFINGPVTFVLKSSIKMCFGTKKKCDSKNCINGTIAHRKTKLSYYDLIYIRLFQTFHGLWKYNYCICLLSSIPQFFDLSLKVLFNSWKSLFTPELMK